MATDWEFHSSESDSHDDDNFCSYTILVKANLSLNCPRGPNIYFFIYLKNTTKNCSSLLTEGYQEILWARQKNRRNMWVSEICAKCIALNTFRNACYRRFQVCKPHFYPKSLNVWGAPNSGSDHARHFSFLFKTGVPFTRGWKWFTDSGQTITVL